MSTAVRSAAMESTSMKAASVVESISSAEPSIAMESSASSESTYGTACCESAPRETAASDEATISHKPTALTDKRPESLMSHEATPNEWPPEERSTVKPRSRTDENSAGKPARSVVAIRRARVRVISIVSILAHRRCSYVPRRSESYAHHDSLRLRQ